MGFWNFERVAELIPMEGAFVRTRLGPTWVIGKYDYYNEREYSVGTVDRLKADQVAAVLNMIGALPPRAKKVSESTDD
jgi:hypothetical protein